MSGPRLCSLRIPNGSNNILLDNFEPTLSPIVYTKRSRFVDEELSDTKEVIVTPGRNSSETKISMVMSNDILTTDLNDNKTDSEKYRESQSKEIIITNGVDNVVSSSGGGAATNLKPCDIDASEKISDSSKINTTTQSSSVSNTNLPINALDVKECAILRHQQLSRVAEWVQNNSIQNNINDDSNDESITDFNMRTTKNQLTNQFHETNILNNCNTAQNIINTPLNSSTNQCNNHSINSNSCSLTTDNNNIIGNATTNMYKTSQFLCDDTKIGNDFAQNNVMQQQLHNVDNIVVSTPPSSSSLSPINMEPETTTSNDIAQMEYNVRQFLLKQNEWSIHNKISSNTSTPSPIVGGFKSLDAGNSVGGATSSNSNSHKLATSIIQQHQSSTLISRPESNSNLLISSTINKSNNATTTTTVVTAATNLRYRTETNL